MSLEKGKKLGFFASLTMLIGSIVGIGIFFKSHGVLRANEWNGTGTLIAWIIGGLLSLGAAFSFAEIGGIKTKNVHGLIGYSEVLGGKRLGYFVRFTRPFFYYGLLLTAVGYFTSEIVIGMVCSWVGASVTNVPIYGHIIIALIILVFFISMNFMSVRASGIVATVSTVLKWIPLVLVALLGIVFATTNNNPVTSSDGKQIFGENAFTNGTSFKFTGMVAALPAVLFAYDSFLNVISMRDKVKNPDKTIPMAVIVGVSSVMFLYTLIALSAVLHGSGMVTGAPFNQPTSAGLGIFDQVLSDSAGRALGKAVVVFLAISALGVTNALSATGVAAMEQSVSTNTMVGSKTLRARFGDRTAEYIITLAVFGFWFIVIAISMAVTKSDSIVDGLSNFPTLFFFAIYAVVIYLYLIKRSKLTNRKFNNVLMLTFGWMAVVGIALLVGYQLIYGFFIDAILHPKEPTHWGLYLGDGGNKLEAFPSGKFSYMSKAQSAIVFFSMLLVFVGSPILNKWLTKKLEGNEVCIDTQAI